jgi:hypothetical protein
VNSFVSGITLSVAPFPFNARGKTVDLTSKLTRKRY